MIFLDSETCGLDGIMVLLQWAKDDGPVSMHEVFCSPIQETIELIEEIVQDEVVGFNLAFDWFHLQKLYNTILNLGARVGFDQEPRDHIDLFARLEENSRDGQCLKPIGSCDLMLHARKGPFQAAMDRKEIRIRKVPNELVPELIEELEQRIHFESYLFARKKTQTRAWKVFDNRIVSGTSDIVCSFAASAALKTIVSELGLSSKDRQVYSELNSPTHPKTLAYAPFATAGVNKDWSFPSWLAKNSFAWPKYIDEHIYFWRYNKSARRYAEDDVIDTRNLFYWMQSQHTSTEPFMSDTDSILSCMVGSVRWKGVTFDANQIKELLHNEKQRIENIPTAPAAVKRWLLDVMDEFQIELTKLDEGTARVKLEKLTEEYGDEEIGRRANQVLLARQAKYKIDLFQKLLLAGRLHPSQTVVGSLSSRMSGRTEGKEGERSQGINSLGIPSEKPIRKAFTLAHEGMTLSGGDFDAFEVSIADAVYSDNNLHNELLTCYVCQTPRTTEQYDLVECPNCGVAEGYCRACSKPTITKNRSCPDCQSSVDVEHTMRKIHGLFAMALFPNETYESIIASKGTHHDMYSMGKQGFFGSIMYGGNEQTLVNRIGVSEEIAQEARNSFYARYPGIHREQETQSSLFCSLKQDKGLGTAFSYYEPDDYVESLFGFRRYFTIENRVVKALYDLTNEIPKKWHQINGFIIRNPERGPQRLGGATMSAIFAAACSIQANVMRAALNHRIQSSGATLTKRLQADIWNLQPAGVSDWVTIPLNIHDEIMAPTVHERVDDLQSIVNNFVSKYRSIVPLLKVDWSPRMRSWAEK